ncbi:putative GTP-binding protein YjiA [compost metagenome]
MIDRVIIETTGLADPGPIAKSIATDPLLCQQLRFAGVLCAVDALQCVEQLRDFALCRQQIASADVAMITKIDLASPESVNKARALIEDLNATARVICRNARVDPLRSIFDSLMCGETQRKASAQGVVQAGRVLKRLGTNSSGLAHDIQSVSVQLNDTFEWVAFSVWLSAFVHCYADSVLRIKGVIRVQGGSQPVLINVVRSFIHPPDNLDGNDELPAGSTLVFIVTGIQPGRIEASLRHFMAR